MFNSLIKFIAEGAPVADTSPKARTRNFVKAFSEKMRRGRETPLGREPKNAPVRMHRSAADVLKEHGQQKNMRKSY